MLPVLSNSEHIFSLFRKRNNCTVISIIDELEARLPVQVFADGILRRLYRGEGRVGDYDWAAALDALGAVDVEHLVPAEDKPTLRFIVIVPGLFRLRGIEFLVEYAETGAGASADIATMGLDLVPGKPLAGFAEEKLVQKGVGFPGGVADCQLLASGPGLLPGNDAGADLFDDAVCDHLINVVSFLCFHCRCGFVGGWLDRPLPFYFSIEILMTGRALVQAMCSTVSASTMR